MYKVYWIFLVWPCLLFSCNYQQNMNLLALQKWSELIARKFESMLRFVCKMSRSPSESIPLCCWNEKRIIKLTIVAIKDWSSSCSWSLCLWHIYDDFNGVILKLCPWCSFTFHFKFILFWTPSKKNTYCTWLYVPLFYKFLGLKFIYLFVYFLFHIYVLAMFWSLTSYIHPDLEGRKIILAMDTRDLSPNVWGLVYFLHLFDV